MHRTAAAPITRGADTYVRGRPDFPPAALTWLREDLGLRPGKTSSLDLGAGTGKFTRLLVGAGAEVKAVEPVAAMRDRLQRDLPGVTALPGTAQHIRLPDSSTDAVICAQAFHWFASAKSRGSRRDPPRVETGGRARTDLERARSVSRLGGRSDPESWRPTTETRPATTTASGARDAPLPRVSAN